MAMTQKAKKDFSNTASIVEPIRVLPNPQEPSLAIKAQMLIALWVISGLMTYAAMH
jgi:hypothetical protein